MLVNRRTFVVRHFDQVIAMVKAESQRVGGNLGAKRIYVAAIGPFNTLAVEWEFANLAEYEKAWDEWFARPETAAFMEKWTALILPGGANEIWELH